LLLDETIAQYSADATRFALADAGDGLDDANIERGTAEKAILRLTAFIEWIKKVIESEHKLMRNGEKDKFADKVFENRINKAIINSKESYSKMKFKEALYYSWFELQQAKDSYIVDCGTDGTHKELIMK